MRQNINVIKQPKPSPSNKYSSNVTSKTERHIDYGPKHNSSPIHKGKKALDPKLLNRDM